MALILSPADSAGLDQEVGVAPKAVTPAEPTVTIARAPVATPLPATTVAPAAILAPVPTAAPTATLAPAPTVVPTVAPMPSPTPGPESIENPLAGQWLSKRPVPTPRGALVAETLQDGIHVVGGSVDGAGSFQLTAHEVYDPMSDTWRPKAPAPDLGTWGPASAVVSGKLFVIGGWPEHHAAMRLYDPQLDTWEYKAPISEEGFSWAHTAAVVGDQIYVIGGYNGIGDGEQLDSKVLRYDPARETWTTGLRPVPVHHQNDRLASGAIGGQIYVVGTGENLQIYDPATDGWSRGADLPIPTVAPSAVVLNQS